MKTKIIIALTLLLRFVKIVFAQEIQKGDVATVPEWEWVEVMNQDTVSKGSRSLSYGESCGIQMGGTVTVVGFDMNRGILVRYKAPGNPKGTPCPSDILFFTTKEKFSTMTDEYIRRLSEIEEQKKSVKKILEQ